MPWKETSAIEQRQEFVEKPTHMNRKDRQERKDHHEPRQGIFFAAAFAGFAFLAVQEIR